jgi:hypothetical protein
MKPEIALSPPLRPVSLVAALAAALAACSSDAASPGGGEGGTPPTSNELDCSLGAEAELPVELSEGGRFATPILAGANVVDLHVASAGPGVERATLEGGELVVRASYGSGAGSAVVLLEGTCGEASTTLDIEVPLRALAWEALPSWTAGTDGPLEREYGSMWIDPASPDTLYVFGGYHYEPEQFTPANDLWSYDLVAQVWTLIDAPEAPFLPGGGLAPTADPGVFLHYGGVSAGSGTEAPTTPLALWRIDVGGATASFTEIQGQMGIPLGDYQPSFVYDAPRERFVTACGANTAWGLHCRIRSFDPEAVSWTELKPALTEVPAGRNGHFFVHDVETERLILFGGDKGGTAGCDCTDDTWALELSEDPPRWVELATEAPPLGRRNGAYVLDPVDHRMFMWGGTPDGATTAPGLWALDLDRGHESWKLVPLEGGPPERSSGRAVYDAPRRRALMGFGNGDQGIHADLWALNL